MEWDKATDVILISSFGVLAMFAFLGLCQWIKRKSIRKVDRTLLAMVPPLSLMAITYFVFDRLWVVSVRPDGSGEPSFPSSHTMIVSTIFFCAMLALPKYIKSKALCAILDLIMLALIVVTAYGRIAANKHWPTDVACGVVFAIIFAIIYFVIKKEKNE